MKFLLPGTKSYYFCVWLTKMIVVNVLIVFGTAIIFGFTTACVISRNILESQSLKIILNRFTKKFILQMVLLSPISLVLFFLAFLNYNLLPEEIYIQIIYAFLLVFVGFVLLVINMFAEYIFLSKQLRLSQLFSIAAINFPKFVFFFSIIAGTAVLLKSGPLVYIFVFTIWGLIAYIAYKIINAYITKLITG